MDKTNKATPIRVHSECIAVAMTEELKLAVANEVNDEKTDEAEDAKKLKLLLEQEQSVRGSKVECLHQQE